MDLSRHTEDTLLPQPVSAGDHSPCHPTHSQGGFRTAWPSVTRMCPNLLPSPHRWVLRDLQLHSFDISWLFPHCEKPSLLNLRGFQLQQVSKQILRGDGCRRCPPHSPPVPQAAREATSYLHSVRVIPEPWGHPKVQAVPKPGVPKCLRLEAREAERLWSGVWSGQRQRPRAR